MHDLRTPIGLFFVLVGLILIAAPRSDAPLAAGTVNLHAGITMLAFGAIMLLLAYRARVTAANQKSRAPDF